MIVNAHHRRGPEHANWRWAAQILATATAGVVAFYLIGRLAGWW